MQHHNTTATTTTATNNQKTLPFPDELIISILLKLHIKSLIRFTTLSKPIRSLILTRPFTTSHFHHHHHHHPPKLLHLDFHFNSTKAHSINTNASLHNNSSQHSLHFPLHNFSHPIPIRGSTRGILLLDDHTNLFLWNPTTNFIKTLSYPPLASSTTTHSLSLGLGYDALNDDYLVVVASSANHSKTTPTPTAKLATTRFEFFSTRAKSWSEIESDRSYYLRVGDQFGCFYNGSIHWLVQFHLGNRNYVITAFDLAQRRLSEEIELPREFNNYSDSCKLRVMGGFLGVCFSNPDDEVEIWVMREYGLSSSWTKKIVVTDYRVPSRYISPICFNEAGEVIARDDRVGLVKFDGRGKLVELRAYCSMSATALYVETLISPPGFDDDDDDDDKG